MEKITSINVFFNSSLHERGEMYSCGFNLISLFKEVSYKEEITNKNYLCFLLDGECVVSYNQYSNLSFVKDSFFFIPKSSRATISIEEECKILVFIFDIPQCNCDRLAFQQLAPYCKDCAYCFKCMVIRYPLNIYLDLLKFYLDKGQCNSYVDKLLESYLFFLLRTLYSKQEMVCIFYPVLGKEIDFKDFILQHYMRVNSIEELIDLSAMCRSSFYTKFKDVFGVSAKKWIMKQKNEILVAKAAELDTEVVDLMDVMGFESQSYLNRYIKRYFHCTPREFLNRHGTAKKER